MAAAIPEAVEVSLVYLVGNLDMLLEKNVLNIIMDIQKLSSKDKAHVFDMLDTFLQSHKAKMFLRRSLQKVLARRHSQFHMFLLYSL